jgi:hypothetical protein
MIVRALNPLRRTYPVLILVLVGVCQFGFAQQAGTDAKRTALEAEMNNALNQVRGIVNQPVTALARTSQMEVSTYRPGWFHQGATRPDFNTVDVRKTQDVKYGQNQFVTSDLIPGLVWLGAQIEYNSMTKYFYTDYTVPKKKLTEEEMLEINRLYRIIGRCAQELAALQQR